MSKEKPTVCVVGHDYTITTMFLRRGWTIVDYIDENIDLIQFTGGEDVDPSYYKEARHPMTRSNPKRDAAEAAVYNEWVGKVYMAGICRRGQFLNVMNGGKMWQHVNHHAVHGTHAATDLRTGQVFQVTSTHHQMMQPSDTADVWLVADEATMKQTAVSQFDGKLWPDYEAIHYPLTKCLCFQPHPEYVAITHECQDLYFDCIKQMKEI